MPCPLSSSRIHPATLSRKNLQRIYALTRAACSHPEDHSAYTGSIRQQHAVTMVFTSDLLPPPQPAAHALTWCLHQTFSHPHHSHQAALNNAHAVAPKGNGWEGRAQRERIMHLSWVTAHTVPLKAARVCSSHATLCNMISMHLCT